MELLKSICKTNTNIPNIDRNTIIFEANIRFKAVKVMEPTLNSTIGSANEDITNPVVMKYIQSQATDPESNFSSEQQFVNRVGIGLNM